MPSLPFVCTLRAHPRVGGENEYGFALADKEAGSSPRGRGKPACTRAAPTWGGLIPAWAGKTTAMDVMAGTVTAHPRVGGENFDVTELLVRNSGSSPRGRGKPRA